MENTSDAAIIDGLRSGIAEERDQALRILYRQYYGMIVSFVKKNQGTKLDAEDLFQEGIVILFRQLRSEGLEIKKNIKTYLYTICRNLWLKELRGRRREISLTEQHEYIPDMGDTLSQIVQTEQTDALLRLLEQLDATCQSVLLLFYYERLAMKRIADLMGYSSAQVAKNKKMKCLEKLRQKSSQAEIFKM